MEETKKISNPLTPYHDISDNYIGVYYPRVTYFMHCVTSVILENFFFFFPLQPDLGYETKSIP